MVETKPTIQMWENNENGYYNLSESCLEFDEAWPNHNFAMTPADMLTVRIMSHDSISEPKKMYIKLADLRAAAEIMALKIEANKSG